MPLGRVRTEPDDRWQSDREVRKTPPGARVFYGHHQMSLLITMHNPIINESDNSIRTWQRQVDEKQQGDQAPRCRLLRRRLRRLHVSVQSVQVSNTMFFVRNIGIILASRKKTSHTHSIQFAIGDM